jgi:hypothetical protein
MTIVSTPTWPIGLTGGRSDALVQGTGRARPGGVESIFEFNGALLNVRDWWDTFLITSIDGLADPDVRDSRDVNPGRHGETYFNAYYGGRTIVITGKIRAFSLSKLRDMQMGLKRIFADLSGEIPLYIRSGNVRTDVFIYVKKSQPIVMAEQQVDFNYTRDFQITLRASNPRFLSYLEERFNYSSAWTPLANPPISQVQAVNLIDNPTAYSNSTTGWSDQSGISGAVFWIGDDSGGRGGGIAPPSPKFESYGFTPPSTGNYFLGMKSETTLNVDIVPGQSYTWIGEYKIRSAPVDVSQITFLVRCWKTNGTWVDFLHSYSVTPGSGSFYVDAFTTSDTSWIQLYAYSYSTAGDQYWEYEFDNMAVTLQSYFGVPFNGDSDIKTYWAGTPYASNSIKLTYTGLEGFYTDDAGIRMFVASDGYVKDMGPRGSGSTSTRKMKRSDQTRKFGGLQTVIKYKTGSNVGSSGSIGELGLMQKILSYNEYLDFQLVPSGTNSRIKLVKNTDAGGAVQLAQSSVFSLAANTAYWLLAKQAGNDLVVQHWLSDPALGGAPTATLSYTLAGAELTKFGSGTVGDFGVRYNISPSLRDWGWTAHTSTPVQTEAALAFLASNEGNAPAQPVIKVFGPLSALSSGGHAVTISGSNTKPNGATNIQALTINAPSGNTLAIPTGNYIEINTDKRTMKLYDVAGNFIKNCYDQIDIDSEWLEIEPGENPIEIQTYAAGASPTIDMRFRHTFF